MFTVGKINIEKGIFLAPMDDISDVSFRLVCKELGADVVYTEFANAEGLIRQSEKTHKKLDIIDEERPVGIQIYGSTISSMVGAAKIAEEQQPDLIDINAGCWIKNICNNGAGAGLLKDPAYLQKLVKNVVDAVELPVTVKTRIGWDAFTLHILEVAKRLEDVGVKALTVHCRTRSQGHSGDPDWSWIPRIKEVVKIPVVLNGGIMTAEDVQRAFKETNADAVMIARGAIGNPWIFEEAKDILNNGKKLHPLSHGKKIRTCLRHLELAIKVKGEERAVIEHRKFYTGYLKGMYNAHVVRNSLMTVYDYHSVEEILLHFLQTLEKVNYAAAV
ncbi:MAG: tRNA dihydrouridine synthase DusB [Ignavibacteria bacterium]|nr:tRNA dihydrouridine synthase DusB [Ignavibacteria bacterium]